MTKDEILRIIEDEDLRYYNWFCDTDIKPNQVGIRKLSDRWSVYTADERACVMSEAFYQDESEALSDFLKRLRADKILGDL